MIQNKTPAATLSGDATQAETDTNFPAPAANYGGNSIPFGRLVGKVWPTSGSDDQTIVATAPANSMVAVAGTACGWPPGSGSGTMHVAVYDNGVLLRDSTVSVSAPSVGLKVVLFVGVPNSGSRTYSVRCWNSNGDALMRANLAVSFIHIQQHA